jgi:hypothetical protein
MLPVGGSKSGTGEKQFHRDLIRVADARFSAHLKRLHPGDNPCAGTGRRLRWTQPKSGHQPGLEESLTFPPLRIIIKDAQRQIDGMRHDSAAAVIEPNSHAFGDSVRVERKIIVLFQEWLTAAAVCQAIAFAGRALPEVAEPAEISVCAWLKQKDFDFVHGGSVTALGNDFSDDAAARAPQLVQFVEPRHPHREIDILAFMGDRHAELSVGCEAGNFAPQRARNGADQRNCLDASALRERRSYPVGGAAKNPLPFKKTAFLGDDGAFAGHLEHGS